jgi:hypothetical protein
MIADAGSVAVRSKAKFDPRRMAATPNRTASAAKKRLVGGTIRRSPLAQEAA